MSGAWAGRLVRRLGPARFGLILLLNLIPVGGVLWLGWDASQILVLYWVENVVIGGLSLVRILTAGDRTPVGPDHQLDSPLATGCFFVVHYGIFTLVHGVLTLVLAARLLGGGAPLWTHVFANPGFHWAVAAVAVLQGVGLARDWWMSGLWRRSSPFAEMFRPYPRIVVMHVTVLGGAWMLSELSAPAGAVLILCVAKGVIEVIGAALTTPAQTRARA